METAKLGDKWQFQTDFAGKPRSTAEKTGVDNALTEMLSTLRVKDVPELSEIHSPEDLTIDYEQVLSMKRGDLAVIQGETFGCHPAKPNLSHIPLVLKRLMCIDRRTYDFKVYEADQLKRLKGHSNIVTLHSYWPEKASTPYCYKVLVLLMEAGTQGNLWNYIENKSLPSCPTRFILKCAGDIAKGLSAMHSNQIIHGGIKPSGVYVASDGSLLLGELKKAELDSARQTHQLFSKVLIGEAMSKTLIYWAPELLAKQDSYTKAVDLWALGVTLFELATGEHPFRVDNEDHFREDVIGANVNWARLIDMPEVEILLRNLLLVDPSKRWEAKQILTYVQSYMVIDIQRRWRGYTERSLFRRKQAAIITLQARIKAFLFSIRYKRNRTQRRNKAASKIQATFRASKQRRKFVCQKLAFMKCQGNVLCRQIHRAYAKIKNDSLTCQAYIRRFLASTWFEKVRSTKISLENNIETIQELIHQYNIEAHEFKEHFVDKSITGPFKHFATYEDYEISQAAAGEAVSEATALPKLHLLATEVKKLREENAQLRRAKPLPPIEESKQLLNKFGPKYEELPEMIDKAKQNFHRLNEMVKQSGPLKIKLQHPYQYSKWDKIHEPSNLVSNLLVEDELTYKSANPSIDLTLQNGSYCFISEVIIFGSEPLPGQIAIYTSNIFNKWTLVKEFTCERTPENRFLIPGEHIAKFLRITVPRNVRGGNIVCLRFIMVKGLVK